MQKRRLQDFSSAEGTKKTVWMAVNTFPCNYTSIMIILKKCVHDESGSFLFNTYIDKDVLIL